MMRIGYQQVTEYKHAYGAQFPGAVGAWSGVFFFGVDGCAAQRLFQHQLTTANWRVANGSFCRLGSRFHRSSLTRRARSSYADHLAQSQKARTFASEHLHLPDNQSYRLYADIGRPYVVWNVFATQEFSLSPENHCFPIAGCVAYRGYYSQGAARGEAALLRQRGMDVSIGGVEAYSTLGWFNDPDHQFNDELGR